MAAQIFPEEVTEHLEAAIHLSNRRVLLRGRCSGVLACVFRRTRNVRDLGIRLDS